MTKLRTAVIGVGYLGKFHAEKYAALPDVELVGVVDADPARAGEVAQKLGTAAFGDPDALLGRVDAVSIVVPTVLHHTVAKRFLDAGVHVLLEKPVSVTLDQADELIAAAERKDLVLQVGHIERFNPAVAAIRSRIVNPRYITAERSAPFTVRCTDVNVVLDLMIHDLDIVCGLAGSEPKELCAAGASIITREIDLATVRIVFENGCVADVTASRVSDEKKRVLRVVDRDELFVSDFQTQKAFLSRKSDGAVAELVSRDISTERCDTLQEEIRAFVQCIRTKTRPLVSGREGRRALALARSVTDVISRGISGFVPVP